VKRYGFTTTPTNPRHFDHGTAQGQTKVPKRERPGATALKGGQGRWPRIEILSHGVRGSG